MSAGPTTARPSQLRLGAQKRLSPAACRPQRGALGRDPAGPRGRGAVRLGALPALNGAASHPAAGGDGHRRLRTRALDARRRVALRGGRARQLSKSTASRICPSCASASRPSSAATSTSEARSALPRRDLPQRQTQGPEGGRALRLGFTEESEQVLVGSASDARVARGLARPRPDLIARGLPAPMLIVADGAPV